MVWNGQPKERSKNIDPKESSKPLLPVLKRKNAQIA
ncbi:MAG: hypothetical protein ACI86M_002441 [Saprospiraceae bacterium]|jgi:hypothetical protein